MNAQPILTILKDGEMIRTQSLEGEAVVGRAEGCVIRLDDRAVSRHHAVFRPTSDGIQVERKSAFAPFSINGQDCTRALLKEGDVISIGPYLMKYSHQRTEAKTTERKAERPDERISPPPLLSVVEPESAVVFEEMPPFEATDDGGAGAAVESVEAVEAAEAVGGTDIFAAENPQVEEISEVTSPISDDSEAELGTTPITFGLETGGSDLNQTGLIEVSAHGMVDPVQGDFPISVDEDAATRVLTSPVDVKLVFTAGTANHTEFAISEEEISIGRGKTCDVILNDKKSSRMNSLIVRSGRKYLIRDLESANGTYVNGRRVTEQELFGNDRIQVGDIEFEFKALSPEYARKEKDFIPVPAEDGEAAIHESGAAPLEYEDFGQQNPPGLSGIPGYSEIPGMPGALAPASQKKFPFNLYDKYIRNFSTLNKNEKIRVVAVGLLFALWVGFDNEVAVKKSVKKTPKTAASSTPGIMTFEMLSKEQQKYVENQHALAFDHYKSKDYDKAIFEIRKIFVLIANYKDSKEIERYALEGKRKLEALEEEKRKKEEEAQLKARISQLVEETRALMDKKHYPQATEIFYQILELDPDNAQVTEWRRIIENHEENLRIQEQERQVQEEINRRAWGIYAEGVELYRAGKFHASIAEFQKVHDLGSNDKKVLAKSKQMIHSAHGQITSLRDPVLVKAKELEAAGELPEAFQEYRRATVIDPPHPAGYVGMDRIRGVLHDRSKAIYTEAVIAESYSDFATAQRKFKELLTVAPQDDIYYERAQRKLANYFKKDEVQ